MQDSIATDIFLGNNCSFILATRGAYRAGDFVEDPAALHPDSHKWTRGSVRKIINESDSTQEKVLEALRLKDSRLHGRELISVPDGIVKLVPALLAVETKKANEKSDCNSSSRGDNSLKNW